MSMNVVNLMAGSLSLGLILLKRYDLFSTGATVCVICGGLYEVYDFFFVRFSHGKIPEYGAGVQLWYG